MIFLLFWLLPAVVCFILYTTEFIRHRNIKGYLDFSDLMVAVAFFVPLFNIVCIFIWIECAYKTNWKDKKFFVKK